MEENKYKLGYQYEPVDLETYSESASSYGAKMENVMYHDAHRMLALFKAKDLSEAKIYMQINQKKLSSRTFIIDTDDPEVVKQFALYRPKLMLNWCPLNRIRHLNTMLAVASESLEEGSYIWTHARTAVLKKRLILEKYPYVIRWVVYFLFVMWHRVFPKLKLTKWLYFGITRGRSRTYNRVEILGRLCRAGFQIVDEEFLHGEFFVLARKVKAPITDDEPSTGPLIKLRRVGKDGKDISVYKFRTMYSYSEYLQDYLYHHSGLDEGGKFKDDYRVTPTGRFLRSVWLDELPMFLNRLKGQMKLVGVRPLSHQYFNLYSPEMQELRIKVKPGLIPPFYYEKVRPETLEDVQASEKKYIEAYLKHPILTDWRYFWGSLYNIVFKRERSK